MIREWLKADGRTCRFDSVTNMLEYRNSDGENVEEVREATPEEYAEYLSYFPDASQDEINRRNALAGQLTNALAALRTATADGVITPTEFGQANPLVQTALLGYRDYPYQSAEIDRLAFLVLSQVSFAYSLLLAQGGATSRALSNVILALEARVAALELKTVGL